MRRSLIDVHHTTYLRDDHHVCTVDPSLPVLEYRHILFLIDFTKPLPKAPFL